MRVPPCREDRLPIRRAPRGGSPPAAAAWWGSPPPRARCRAWPSSRAGSGPARPASRLRGRRSARRRSRSRYERSRLRLLFGSGDQLDDGAVLGHEHRARDALAVLGAHLPIAVDRLVQGPIVAVDVLVEAELLAGAVVGLERLDQSRFEQVL